MPLGIIFRVVQCQRHHEWSDPYYLSWKRKKTKKKQANKNARSQKSSWSISLCGGLLLVDVAGTGVSNSVFISLSVSYNNVMNALSELLAYSGEKYVSQQYCQTYNISCTLVSNKIVDHSDVVGASPVGTAPTTSSFSTKHRLQCIGQRQLQDKTRRWETFEFWDLVWLLLEICINVSIMW